MEHYTILIVEDDPDINTLLRKMLEKAGYAVVQAYSGTEAKLLIEQNTAFEKPGSSPAVTFDLILLDLMLPGMTGEELLTYVRTEQKLATPIIIISAKVSVADKVGTLGQGADDYLTKPFEPEEVLARIQAVLRRTGSGEPDKTLGQTQGGQTQKEPSSLCSDATDYTYKDLSLNPTTRRVTLQGKGVALTQHEFDLLCILIQQPDTVFSRERLYELVWKSGYYGEDNTINVHVSNIRKKLAAAGASEEYIKTVWGIGFKLV